VTQQFAPDGVSTEPYITIVAAPSLATLGVLDAAHPPGLVYSEFRDKEVLASYALPAAPGPHHPFVAAAEGFSRKVKLPGIVDLLTFLPLSLLYLTHYCPFPSPFLSPPALVSPIFPFNTMPCSLPQPFHAPTRAQPNLCFMTTPLPDSCSPLNLAQSPMACNLALPPSPLHA
jgi:hypothetical protein